MKSSFIKKIMQLLGLIIILAMAWLSIISNKSITLEPNILGENQIFTCSGSKKCISEVITMGHFDKFDIRQIDNFFQDCNLSNKTNSYRHFICKNQFLQFVEDVEIEVIQNSINYRSASRVDHLIFYGHDLRLQRFVLFLESVTNPNE